LAIAELGASQVPGIDSNSRRLDAAIRWLDETEQHAKVSFAEELQSEHRGKFDIVISQNSMEHFRDPKAAIDEMSSALNANGYLIITLGPPWYAPYGSHMHFFSKAP
jgi:2-polyprenyl-3-methyl-5-hydroxy-6-metoxy-1,4-benzoquinol methylase